MSADHTVLLPPQIWLNCISLLQRWRFHAQSHIWPPSRWQGKSIIPSLFEMLLFATCTLCISSCHYAPLKIVCLHLFLSLPGDSWRERDAVPLAFPIQRGPSYLCQSALVGPVLHLPLHLKVLLAFHCSLVISSLPPSGLSPPGGLWWELAIGEECFSCGSSSVRGQPLLLQGCASDWCWTGCAWGCPGPLLHSCGPGHGWYPCCRTCCLPLKLIGFVFAFIFISLSRSFWIPAQPPVCWLPCPDHRLVESAFSPIIQVLSEDVKQCWPQYWPLRVLILNYLTGLSWGVDMLHVSTDEA